MRKPRFRLKILTQSLAVSLVAGLAPFAAQAVVIDDLPPYLSSTAVPPNIILTVDDSGSMTSECMPNSPVTSRWNNSYRYGSGPRRFEVYKFTSHQNTLWYNPDVEYGAGVDNDGDLCADANYITGDLGATGCETKGYSEGTRDATWLHAASSSSKNVGYCKIPYPVPRKFNTSWNTSGCESITETFTITNKTNNTSRNCLTKQAWDASDNTVKNQYKYLRSRFAFYWKYTLDTNSDGDVDLDDIYDASANNLANTNNYERVDIINPNITYNAPPSGWPVGEGAPSSSYTSLGVVDGAKDTRITRTYEEEIQNFANWFMHNSTRIKAAKTALGPVMVDLSKGEIDSATAEWRLAVQVLNGGSSTQGTTGTYSRSSSPRPTTQPARVGSNLSSLATWINGNGASGSTPLRRQISRAGNYLSNPAVATIGSNTYTCQQNYHIMMTDGYWNSSASSTSPGKVCDNITLPDGTPFPPTPSYPYTDRTNGSCDGTEGVADVAAYYWKTDLLPSLENKVPAASEDPATWQHLVSYHIGFGVEGERSTGPFDPDLTAYQSSYFNFPDPTDPALLPGTDWYSLAKGNVNWPDAASDSPRSIDDLWHGAVVSRGRYYSAKNPQALKEAFEEIVAKLTEREASSSQFAVTSSRLSEGSQVIGAKFFSRIWAGQLTSYAEDPLTGDELKEVCDPTCKSVAAVWDAQKVLTAQGWEEWDNSATLETPMSGRRIITCGTVDGDCSGDNRPLPKDSAYAHLDDQDVNYIRGNILLDNQQIDPAASSIIETSLPNNDTYRGHYGKLLGDIVDSSPVYVGKSTSLYNFQDHAKYRARTGEDREPVVYVAANDGLLHAFYAPDVKNNPLQLDLENRPITETKYDTITPNGGKELFAYLPYSVLYARNVAGEVEDPKLLTEPWADAYKLGVRIGKNDFTHQSIFGGTPVVGDWNENPSAANGEGWRTILVGGFGNGAKGLYALDVTNLDGYAKKIETSDTEANLAAKGLVLWERTDHGLGNVYSPPMVIAVYDASSSHLCGNVKCSWVVATGSGFNSATQKIVFLDPATGDLVKGVDVFSTTTDKNGLTYLTPVDVDNNGVTDYIYGGDLQGGLYKIDLAPANVDQSDNDVHNPRVVKLFDTSLVAGHVQPITTKPVVTRNNARDLLVLFGTGAYLNDEAHDVLGSDKSDLVESVYGIVDLSSDYTGADVSSYITVDKLVKQEFSGLASWSPDGDGKREVKALSTQSISIGPKGATYHGWKLDLWPGGGGYAAERLVTDPGLLHGLFVIPTFIPSEDPCDNGGVSFLTAVDYNYGGSESSKGGGIPLDPFGWKKWTGADVHSVKLGVGGKPTIPTFQLSKKAFTINISSGGETTSSINPIESGEGQKLYPLSPAVIKSWREILEYD